LNSPITETLPLPPHQLPLLDLNFITTNQDDFHDLIYKIWNIHAENSFWQWILRKHKTHLSWIDITLNLRFFFMLTEKFKNGIKLRI
jgi:hypothetical protein